MTAAKKKSLSKAPTKRDLELLDEAQDLVFDAWDAASSKVRKAKALKAIAISPLCADAFGILAGFEKAGSPAELEMWRKAIEAGERSLGAKAFREMEGEFWGWAETRPYMRARQGLGLALWRRGDVAVAADEFFDMLRLNPNDNQGIRYILVTILLELGRLDDVTALLAQYDEESAVWAYSAALLAFQRLGDGDEARRKLDVALRANAHVPGYLLGITAIPKSRSPFVGIGDQSEAQNYAEHNASLWTSAPGALDWLRVTARVSPTSRTH
mgnify:CR=1 FL=1